MNILILMIGVFFCATAIIFIKATTVHPVFLASLRLLIAVVALTPLFIREYRKASLNLIEYFKPALVPGMLLGAHFVSWNMAGRMTYAANASLIVNLVPVVMPLMLWLMVREKVTRAELVGTCTTMAGVLLLVGADFHFDKEYFIGDVFCFVSMLFFAVYLVVGKRKRAYSSIWLYVVPIYFLAGILCLFATLFFLDDSVFHLPPGQLPLVLGLGLLPTVMGHSILNWAFGHMRGQLVSLLIMGQFIFAGAMAFVFCGEIPVVAFYPACVLVVAGACIAVGKPAR